MARNNYGFEKRQRELSKEKKKEEKRLRKLERTSEEQAADGTAGAGEEPTPDRQG